jgi:DNA-directed RNA polymerase specialized sigma24 family protein
MQKLKRELLTLEQELFELRKFHLTATTYDRIYYSVKNFKASSPERMTEKVERLQGVLTSKMADFVSEVKSAEDLIERLDNPDYRAVLREHYINGLPFAQISRKMYYSLRTVKKYARAAVESLGKMNELKNNS